MDLHQGIDEVKALMKNYIDKLKENITDRLTHQNGDIIHNLGAIYEPTVFDEELANEAINDLAKFYGTAKTVESTHDEQTVVTVVQPILHKESLLQERPKFKGMLKGTYKYTKTAILCKKVIKLHLERLPNTAKLTQIAMSFCLTSVALWKIIFSAKQTQIKIQMFTERGESWLSDVHENWGAWNGALIHLQPSDYDKSWRFCLCLCWGFTAQSTQRGHVERGQFS